MLVETVKKGWMQNKAWHYRVLDNNPFHKEHFIPPNASLAQEEVEIPVISRKNNQSFQDRLKKAKKKKTL